MPGLLPDVDPDGLLEYSVVFTDHALNHMSLKFQRVMRDISAVLKDVYGGRSAIVVPGSGTFGMEAVARQFATGRKTLVIRNGWFSYRWTQIFEMGQIPSAQVVLKARPVRSGPEAPFAPAAIDEVVAAIREQRPALVFAPHVETAAGMMLPDGYLRAVADAVHDVGGSQKARVLRLIRQLQHEPSPSRKVDQRPVDPLFSMPCETYSTPEFPVPGSG